MITVDDINSMDIEELKSGFFGLMEEVVTECGDDQEQSVAEQEEAVTLE